MSTNLGLGQAHESYFGPSSGELDVVEFLNATRALASRETCQTLPSDTESGVQRIQDDLQQSWTSLPAAQQDTVARECRSFSLSVRTCLD
ncbi:hypothetical protein C8Q72DRAFT_836024 [Fomitopsis betulina]|nr:hypothetical protein C8Q72DRAFT_836024 [Fomitopsis betulina]